MTTTYYVKASPSGSIAACSYFTDPQATQPVPADALTVPEGDSGCNVAEADGCELALLGATFKTLGRVPVMTDSNFAAAVSGQVTVPMPTTQVVTKGVVLIFSDRESVATLYASADPQVTNGDQCPKP